MAHLTILSDIYQKSKVQKSLFLTMTFPSTVRLYSNPVHLLIRRFSLVNLILLWSTAAFSSSFVLTPFFRPRIQRNSSPFVFRPPSIARTPVVLLMSPSNEKSVSTMQDISKMKVSELRQELESYGIPTKSFLEKRDLAAAVEEARKRGAKPSSPSSSPSPNDSNSSSTKSRDERLAEEIKKANKMRVKELKEHLQELGVNHRVFLEKQDFVRAYAEAIVDGVETPKRGSRRNDEQVYDPSFRDVSMQKFDDREQQLLQGTVIDVPLR